MIAMKIGQRPRGRPRAFDENEVLLTVRDLFWERGYEGTSMKDIVDALGMAPPSIYAAFGSKEALFKRILDLYSASFGQEMLRAFFSTGDIREATAALLRSWAALLVDPSHPPGCMISLGMVCHAPENVRIAEDLSSRRGATKALFLNRFATVRDRLPPGIEPEDLANYLAMVVSGMSVLARDGASGGALKQVAELAMMAWPPSEGARPNPDGRP